MTLVTMNFYRMEDDETARNKVVYAACSMDCALVGFSSFSSLTL